MKKLERWIKQAYLDSRILLHYGTLQPKRIPIHDSSLHLHVDPTDWRARKKIIAGNMRGRVTRNLKFWRMAVDLLRPDTILDIGLNYGECLFAATYPPDCQLFGFEANPTLREFVERSAEEHPDGARMQFLFQLVTDGDEGVQEFFIDRDWSGGSTAGLDPDSYDAKRYEKVLVPKSSIDRALSDRDVEPGDLFFKIDVEGYEFRVLSGMSRCLAEADTALGFVEFDPTLLRQAGEDVDAYWEFLQDQFTLLAFDRGDGCHAVSGKTLAELKAVCGKHFHTDLVLIGSRNVELADHIQSAWTRRSSRRAA